MDWSKPVAKRTRRSEALYYKELHRRIKLERSGVGGSWDGRLECESEGSVVGGCFKECSGSEVGRKRRKGILVSDSDDDVVEVGCEERSVGSNVGVNVEEGSVVFDGVEVSGGVLDVDGGNVELSINNMIPELKVKEDAVLIDEDDVKEDAIDEAGTKLKEDADLVDDDDDGVSEEERDESVEKTDDDDEEWTPNSYHEKNDVGGSLRDSEYEVSKSSKGVVADDDRSDFAERLQKKPEYSNVLQKSGKCIWNDGEGIHGWIAYDSGGGYVLDSGDEENIDAINVLNSRTADSSERLQRKPEYSDVLPESGKWIWNDGEGIYGWITFDTGAGYVLDSGDEENIDGIGVLKSRSADDDSKYNFSTIKRGEYTQNNLVGTRDDNLPDVNTTSKSQSKSNKIEGGSFNQPFRMEEEDDDDYILKQMSKRGKLGVSTNPKQRCPQKHSNILQNLVDLMFNDNDGSLEELASQQTTVPASTKEPFPLKFTFGVIKTSPPQQTEFEKELDELWDEFDLARSESDISNTVVGKVDRPAASSTELPTKHMPPYCPNGQHEFAIDDEIGIKCKYCSFVKLEIRHLMPSFSKHQYRRFEKKHLQDEDDYVGFDGKPFEDFVSNTDTESDCKQRIYATGTVWDLIPGIREGMHPHQQEGLEFIWRNIAGGIKLSELPKRTCSHNGNGCIISHAPGTGKSRLTIVFLQTYMKLYPECRPVIIAPRSMLLSWEAELCKWKFDIPFHNLNLPELSGKENAGAVNLFGRANHDISSTRLLKLYSWKKDGGLLGLSYNLYERLAGEISVERKRKRSKKTSQCDQESQKILLETPNLLVLDEGHTPRNEKSLIWKALCKIQTEKRIILSGTPFQNNFEELFNTLCLVRPKFADSIQSCDWMGRRRQWRLSAAKGKWFNLTSPIGKLDEGKVSLERLRCMLDSFVHIYKGNILQKSLPGLRDSLIVLRPGEFQKRILEGVYTLENYLRRNHVASLVSLHPSLLPESERVHFPCDKDKFERLRLNPEAGVKTKFLIELIRRSEATKEKVLVFSEFIDPLNFIRDLLKSYFGWTEGEEILYMDGGIDVRQRQSSINTFNDLSSGARVLLASKRACSEGINLVGASRLVLLDVVWNPSVERQAISRAYRLGQTRVVHVYQLITGTMEWDKYCKQAKKSLLSELVFSSTDKDDSANVTSNIISGDLILESMVQLSSFKDILEKIIHQPKESSLIETFGLVDEECTF